MSGHSVTGIIPEELLFPARLGDVIDLIKVIPVPGYYKVQLLFNWSRTVGVKISASQLEVVRRTGTDRQPAAQ